MRKMLLVALCCASLASAQAADSVEEAVNLQDISQSNQAGKSFLANATLNAPMAKVCSTIQDYANYPQFMPNTAKTVVKLLPDNTSLVDFTLHLPLGKVKQYRLKMSPKSTPKSCELSWKLQAWEGLKTEETIADTSGFWHLSPKPDNPQQTLVKYQVYTDPGPVPLGLGWIVDSMSRDSIPKMFEALRKRLQ